MNTEKTLMRCINAFCLCCVALVAVGCGEGDFAKDAVADANKNNVQRVANCYMFFQMSSKGYRGPANLEEFKTFLANPDNAQNLELMGADPSNIDAMFISERDNEPIKVRFSVVGSARGCNEPVAFETTGVDGVRLVGFTTSKVKEVSDAAEYDQMFSGKYVADEATRTSDAAPSNASDMGKGG